MLMMGRSITVIGKGPLTMITEVYKGTCQVHIQESHLRGRKESWCGMAKGKGKSRQTFIDN